ncbi:MAG: ATP-dependent DNA helicase RecG [Lachnospiraceae bacterium]|nr:ATP-dependent DNA helicase RecG [Lachnospiraceae bacterium]
MNGLYYSESIGSIKGVGEKTEKLFNKLGVYTISDILLSFPRTYISYDEPLEREEDIPDGSDGPVALKAVAVGKPILKRTKRMDITIVKAALKDSPLDLLWFRSPYIRSKINDGETYIFYGKVVYESTCPKMEQPLIFTEQEYNEIKTGLQPVYHLTKSLTNNAYRKAVKQALSLAEFPSDYISVQKKAKRDLISIKDAINGIHFPSDTENLIQARKRLVYDEFFRFFFYMYTDKEQKAPAENRFPVTDIDNDSLYKGIIENLPFELTKGQADAVDDIKKDFAGSVSSERMIQGDVGSGKTMIAFIAMAMQVINGRKACIMAPTEVLARQHYETFKEYIELFKLPFNVVCLTGSTKGKERKEIYASFKEDGPLFIVGTQALIQEKPEFKDLSLVITDEQHRFGVKQRRDMSLKGEEPHIMVMSATPIPRSLAMILYGDMSISVIKDVPARRKPIKNAVMKASEREKAFMFMAKQVSEGHQCYIICPLVEASDKTEAENVTEYAKDLRSYYQNNRMDINVGLLHGKMKNEEKNTVMSEFAAGEIKILVSTTVVEVGVNVPNATVMMIENAEKFGLAQLHQLRGRVGRGDAQSYCIFMDGSDGKDTSKRLDIVKNSNDGFYIASEDLKLRGPGDFLGIRQSGDMNFSLADIYQDSDIMRQASDDVKEYIKNIPAGYAEYLKFFSSTTYTNL